jgi:hypothetical protein
MKIRELIGGKKEPEEQEEVEYLLRGRTGKLCFHVFARDAEEARERAIPDIAEFLGVSEDLAKSIARQLKVSRVERD